MHILAINLASLDPINDGGRLLAHRAFFDHVASRCTDCMMEGLVIELLRDCAELEDGDYYGMITPLLLVDLDSNDAVVDAVPVSVRLFPVLVQ